MASKFDQIIESIVNNDEKKARSLFHNFVVNRSRKIYEGLEEQDPMQQEGADDFIDEVHSEETHSDHDGGDFDDADAESESSFGSDDEFSDVGGDESDDLLDDTGFDEGSADVADFDEASGVENADMEDRVVDLEDELDSLKAEFAALMGNEDSGEGDDDDFGGDDSDTEVEDDFETEDEDGDDFEGEDESEETSDEDDDFEDESEDEDFDDTEDDDEETIKEYVEKVAKPGNSEMSNTNTKSIVAGKNDMGGTAKNLVHGGTENGRTTPSSQTMNTKNVNVPGGKAKLSNAPKAKNSEEANTNKKSTY